ncbi:MAG: peptide-methionine (R)-S-oxide reductase MsrB [Promethearchaeota archaeon]|jgi:peptide-methionine (R)-S-oxide reductase
MESKVTKDEWKKKLTKAQYKVLREKGTEPAFTGKYFDHHEKGIYKCAGCGAPLFTSDEKFDSGTGWPSFNEPYQEESIEEKLDTSHGMRRTEVLCRKCGGHLGHVFNDGPSPTGCRYCINSVSLDFEPRIEE